jgi:hypothetical protein
MAQAAEDSPSQLDELISQWQGARVSAKEQKMRWQEEEDRMLALTNRLGDTLLPPDSRVGDTFVFQVSLPGFPTHPAKTLLITKISGVRHRGESNFNIRWKS